MPEFEIVIDGAPVIANQGETLLAAALRAGVFIPHLCSDGDVVGEGSACRLCFVEVEGTSAPVCACEVLAEPGMKVSTKGEAANKLAAAALDLIIADHAVSCGSCVRKGACLIIQSAKALGVPLKASKELHYNERRQELAEILPEGCVVVDHDKCVLCGRCISVCKTAGKSYFGLTGRGLNALIAIDAKANAEECAQCASCVDACPAGALSIKPL